MDYEINPAQPYYAKVTFTQDERGLLHNAALAKIAAYRCLKTERTKDQDDEVRFCNWLCLWDTTHYRTFGRLDTAKLEMMSNWLIEYELQASYEQVSLVGGLGAELEAVSRVVDVEAVGILSLPPYTVEQIEQEIANVRIEDSPASLFPDGTS